MPFLPEIPNGNGQVINTTQFLGLNRGLSISDGEMADMLNMSSDDLPVLSTRKARGVPTFEPTATVTPDLAGEIGGMVGTDRLVVCHEDKVYVDGVQVPVTLSTDASKREKKLVTMGAYVCIWPDKVYFNVNNLDDCGEMSSKWTPADGETISAMMCRKDGTDYDMDNITVSDVAPSNPADGQFWLDMSGETDVLKQYSKLYAEWVQVATTYIKIQSPGIGKGIKTLDSVWMSGAAIDAQNTEAVEPGTLVFAGKDVQLNTTWTERWDKEEGGDRVVTDPTADEKTISINVEGIPYGAYVESAKLTFQASTTYGALDPRDVLTVNGTEFALGSSSIDIDVSRNSTVNFKYYWKPRFIREYSYEIGTKNASLFITNIKLTVNYAPANLSDEESDLDQIERLNTSNTVYGCGDDYIIVAGILHRHLTLRNSLTVEMKVPDLDYICEANNRIWGCVYAEPDGTVVNELRCCALGDFRNWYKFQGTAADSYTVTVGSDGIFTGAFSLQGVPMFFKENYIHKVPGTIPANFTVNTLRGRGVQDGCWKSLAVVNETLFYKSRNDVMAYEGAMPFSAGAKLGTEYHEKAVGGGYRDKYYLCMRDTRRKWHTYVLDTTKGLWHQEGEERISDMTTIDGELVMAIRDEAAAATRSTGATHLRTVNPRGDAEEIFDWSATFGTFGYQQEKQKYLSRYNIRAQISAGGWMKVEMQYDSDGKWHHMGTMKSPKLRTYLLPIIPRRCDHCQLRISGKGNVNIYSIARIYENGGDG